MVVKTIVDVKDLPIELQGIYRLLHEYFNDEENNSMSLDDLAARWFATRPKDRDFYIQLFENLAKLEVQEGSVKALCVSLRKGQLLKELSMAAYNASEGDSKAYEAVKEQLATLDAFDDNESLEEVSEFEYVAADLQQLLDKTYLQPGLRWRMDSLNKSLGSLRPGDFGFLFARPECFTPDTEVLTTQGWLPVAEVTLDTPLAAVTNNLHTHFEKPSLVTKRDDFETVWDIYNRKGQLNLSVSPGHRMTYTKEGVWQEACASNIQYKQGMKTHTSTRGVGGTNKLSKLDQLRIAYQADGRTRVYETHGYSEHKYGYEISVLKPRKMHRLFGILHGLHGVTYTTWKDKRGHTGFYIKTDVELTKDFSDISLEDKGFVWCQQFVEELMYWDGSQRSETRWKYSNTNKDAVNKVQAIVALSGYNSYLSDIPDKRGYTTCYEVHIRSDYTPVDGQSVRKSERANTESLYCFSVSTGMLLVRRKGVVAVVGNTGKTTFLTSEGSYFAEQAVEKGLGPILHLNNEGEDDKILLRYYQSVLGATLAQILSNREKAQRVFMEKTQGKIVLPRLGSFTSRHVEKLMEIHKPSLVVVDQVDNVQGFDADREDLRLGKIYEWLRRCAKQCPIIGVTQANGDGEGAKWLTMAHVSNAKTSKQATADFIFGIGKVHDEAYDNIRFMNISKNKLLGDPDTDPRKRHSRWEVVIEKEAARYRDL